MLIHKIGVGWELLRALGNYLNIVMPSLGTYTK
jgi:hypothetical protein